MMKTIDLTWPSYSEVLHFLSESDVKSVLFIILCFCLGFLLRRLLSRKTMKEISYEIEEMRTRLKGAVSLLATMGIPIDEIPVSFKGALPESESRHAIKDIDITRGKAAQRTGESEDLRNMHEARQRRVCITKLIGEEDNGITLQAPICGFEGSRPGVGEPYQIVLEDGDNLVTSVVVKISDEYVHTRNSLYKVEVLEVLNGQRNN